MHWTNLLLATLSVMALTACANTSAPQTITLTAHAVTYDLTRLTVTAGQPVRLQFINTDTVEHDFNIAQIPVQAMTSDSASHAHGDMAHATGDVHVMAQAGQRAEIIFTPTEPGVYEFFCTVPGHKEAGMTGQLVVQAP